MFSLQFFMQKISFRQSVLREYPNFIFAPRHARGSVNFLTSLKKNLKKVRGSTASRHRVVFSIFSSGSCPTRHLVHNHLRPGCLGTGLASPA
jgi:hypothetical protein